MPFRVNPSNAQFHYVETTTSNTETHDIFDFMAGKDVGLGALGLDGTSVLSGGLRFAQFRTESGLAVYSDPDYTNPNITSITGPKYWHNFSAKANNKASFTGIGPALSWDASTPVEGKTQTGQITVDWGLNGAVLFGRQKSQGDHQTMGKLSTGVLSTRVRIFITPPTTRMAAPTIARAWSRCRMWADRGPFIPLPNAKVSFGYRVDEFFGAMDGGIDTHKSYNFGTPDRS